MKQEAIMNSAKLDNLIAQYCERFGDTVDLFQFASATEAEAAIEKALETGQEMGIAPEGVDW